jgi:hypothetical protein
VAALSSGVSRFSTPPTHSQLAFDEGRARGAIRLTQSRYLVARDSDNLAHVGSTFTEDAILDTANDQHLGRRAILLALGGRSRPRVAGERRTSALFRRHLTTSHIEFDGESTARVVSYFIAFTSSGMDHSGAYTDTYVPVGPQWLISHRRVTVDWVSPTPRGEGRETARARLLG